jgi:hypothetical protein
MYRNLRAMILQEKEKRVQERRVAKSAKKQLVFFASD